MPPIGNWNRTPPNYTIGESVVGIVSGNATTTTGSTVTTVGPAEVPTKTNSGELGTALFGEFQVTTPGGSITEEWVIDQSRPITGLGNRPVTYGPDGKSFTVVA